MQWQLADVIASRPRKFPKQGQSARSFVWRRQTETSWLSLIQVFQLLGLLRLVPTIPIASPSLKVLVGSILWVLMNLALQLQRLSCSIEVQLLQPHGLGASM